MPLPIACTLTADAADDRIEEWRRFLAGSVGRVERKGDHHLRVELKGSPRVLESAVDLAQREKACCAFFEFSIDLEADASWLSVKVPSDAPPAALDDFAALLPDSR